MASPARIIDTMALPRRSDADPVDPFVIRYLDGSTMSDPVPAASPARADLSLVSREAIQTGRLLAALSTALDLTEGQLPGHSLRTCFLAMRVAAELGLSETDRETLPDRAMAITREEVGDHLAADAVDALAWFVG